MKFIICSGFLHLFSFLFFQVPDPALQRLMYLSGPPAGHPAAYYQMHPNSYLGPSAPPGQVVRLPTPGTPPMIMTPPPVLSNSRYVALLLYAF